VLSPSQMLSQLGNRFEFLVSRKRGLAERQRTLRAAIDWSYRLLTPDVQKFFCHLCVFRGGWSLEAAESVCEEPLALDMLAQLRECSLITTVESESGIRFRMLETLREYAQSQLSPEELSAVQERHARFFLALAEEAEPLLLGWDQVIWLDRLESEHDNLRAVLAWSSESGGDSTVGLRLARAIRRFWFLRSYSREGRDFLVRALAQPPEGDQASLAKTLFVAASMSSNCGDYVAAEKFGTESLEIYRKLGDQRGIVDLLLQLGGTAKRDNMVAAKRLCTEALALSRQIAYPRGIAAAAYQLGINASVRGDMATARAHYEESLTIYKELGDRRGIYLALNNLAMLASDGGDDNAARGLYEQSLTLARELKDPWGIAGILMNLGTVANDQGDYSAARALFEESLAIGRKYDSSHGIAGPLLNMGLIAFREGDPVSARTFYRESLRRFAKLGYHQTTIDCLKRLASVAPPVLGAVLWGAAEHLNKDMDDSYPSRSQEIYEQQVAAAREALGDDAAFDRAWQEGRAMTLEQAVAYALEESGE
uniref:ATP-binding protein n=1 Tax=Armatimonas sp. TaxID=1872638 RepID=UPI003750BF66